MSLSRIRTIFDRVCHHEFWIFGKLICLRSREVKLPLCATSYISKNHGNRPCIAMLVLNQQNHHPAQLFGVLCVYSDGSPLPSETRVKYPNLNFTGSHVAPHKDIHTSRQQDVGVLLVESDVVAVPDESRHQHRLVNLHDLEGRQHGGGFALIQFHLSSLLT